MDGFDVADTSVKWVSSGTVPSSTATRYGRGRAASLNGSSFIKKLVTPSSKIIVGFAYCYTDPSARSLVSFHADAGATTHVNVRINATGAVEIYRGAVLLAATASGIISTLDNWYYIEVSATLSDTVGNVVVRVDGAVVLTFTGDTKNAGTSTLIDAVGVGYWTSGVQYFAYGRFDDLYVLNDQGATLNAFLGETSIYTLLPDGAGSLTEQTPVGDPANWKNVNKVPYSATTYNSATVANKRDLYTLGDIAETTAVIHAAVTTVIAKRVDTGTAAVRTLLRSGGTTYQGPDTPLTPNLALIQQQRLTNPATGNPWTTAELNTIELGSEIL